MELLRYEPKTPAENLALDEFLLTQAEEERRGGLLRFWESTEYFVVLGRAGKVSEECLPDLCRKDGVKVLRRVSGGGTVLQGPGCLNYSLTLPYADSEDYRDIRASYRLILGKIKQELNVCGYNVKLFPLSDLAIDGKKISGNAQARKRDFFLHHGTLLFDFDIEKVSRYIKHPPNEPDYRGKRLHSDFIANIPAKRETLERIVIKAFPCEGAAGYLSAGETAKLRQLAEDKYSKDWWNREF